MLRKGPMYRHCRTRIFLLVEDEEGEKRQMADVTRYCYQLRLSVDVVVLRIDRIDQISAVSHVHRLRVSEGGLLGGRRGVKGNRG